MFVLSRCIVNRREIFRVKICAVLLEAIVKQNGGAGIYQCIGQITGKKRKQKKNNFHF